MLWHFTPSPHHLLHLSKPEQPSEGLAHRSPASRPALPLAELCEPAEPSLTSASPGVFVVSITFTIVMTQGLSLQARRSRQRQARNPSCAAPCCAAPAKGGQKKGSQQGRKGAAEPSKGAGTHSSPHQVLSFLLHHSKKKKKKNPNLICSLHLNLTFGCRGPGWHRKHNLRVSSLMLGKLGPLSNPLSVCITLHIGYVLMRGDFCMLNNIHMLPRRYFLFLVLPCH